MKSEVCKTIVLTTQGTTFLSKNVQSIVITVYSKLYSIRILISLYLMALVMTVKSEVGIFRVNFRKVM